MSRPLPASLISSLQNVTGFNEPGFVALHAGGEQITSVRLNPRKLFDIHQSDLPVDGNIPWSSMGYYLSQRPSFTSDPLFHAGAYYVQEASSMFLEEAVRQTCDLSKPLKLLDLCGAPGGKSTLLQSIISDDSLLVSNEVIKSRVNVLAENITKWGAKNVVVTNNDPKEFQRLPGYFDVIVIDAPCSGSGLFRKDPGAIDEWSPANVILCSLRQQRILADVLPALKPGGILIYSTCSYSPDEDEAVCDWLLSDDKHAVQSLSLDVNPAWNIVPTRSPQRDGYGYRFYPDKLKGEGFYLAAFKKATGEISAPEIKIKSRTALVTTQEASLIMPFISGTDTLSFFKWQDDILAFPSTLLSELFVLQSRLYIKKAGVKIGQLIRDELIPDHELALAGFTTEKIFSVDADLENALQYLRRANLNIEIKYKGWALIRYQHVSLGWIKILPNRINNYYPKEWRILNK